MISCEDARGSRAVMFRYNFRKYGDKKLNAAIDACGQGRTWGSSP